MAANKTLPGVHVDRVLNEKQKQDQRANSLDNLDKTNGVKTVVPRKPLSNDSAILKPKKTKAKQGYFRWFLSVFTRLLTWYSIITILFRCPATQQDITDTTPKVCKPYFELKSTLLPHVTPYYNKYASPYVESAKPYYDIVDKHVVAPAKIYGTKYGGPRVQQAQAIGKAQWEKAVQPQLTKANDIYRQKYDQYAATHVNKLTESAGPYYKFAKDNALLTYHASILPTYNLLHPYALQGYEQGRHHTIHTVYPLVKRATNSTMNFLDRNVLPKIKILYGENVEPQLIRIGERLGRYRDGKKVKAAVEEVNRSASMSVLSSTIASASSTIVSRSTSTVSVAEKPTTTTTSTISQIHATGSVKPAETSLTEAEQRTKAQQIVEDDLRIWQQKVSKATEEGSNELETRIAEITDRAITKQARVVGRAHLIRLEEAVATEMKSLKKSIISIVKLKYTEEDINRAVRKAGLNIRDKAQAVREWRQKYDKEVNELVAKAAEDTFQIIDHIRDLGLQEIGMRWAWTDGVTHKDWTKYHALKNKFEEWRHEVEEVATGHPGLIHARNESEDVEAMAMHIAEDAAKELATLKETGKWKLAAGDASGDFNTRHMPVAAHQAAQKIVDMGEQAKQAVVGTASSQGTMESLSSVAGESVGSMSASAASVASQVTEGAGGYAAEASKSAQSAAQSLSARLAGSSTKGTVNSAIERAQASASSLAAQASASVIGTSQGTVESLASVASASAQSLKDQASASAVSAASQASISASSLSAQASQSVYGTPQGSVESVISKASASVIGTSQGTSESVASVAFASAQSLKDQASISAQSMASQVSRSVYDTPQGSVESIISKASSAVAGTSQGTAKSLSSVVAASASSLSAKHSPVVAAGAQKVVENVHEAASSASSVASSVGSVASESISSVASSISSVAPSSATSASKSASSYASSMSKVGSSSASSASKVVSSSASSVSSSVSSAASKSSSSYSSSSSSSSAKASQTPIIKKVWGGAMAQEVKERHIIYEDVVEDDVVDTDETYSQKIQDMANHAGDRFHHITSAVSEALIHQHKATATQTPGAVESATSLASAQYASALSAASVALYGTTTTPQGAAESVVSVASSRYADAVKAASSVIYGTLSPSSNSAAARATAAYNSALSQANAHYSNALSMVSAQISGTPKPSHEAMFSSVQASYSSALAAANSRLASASPKGSVGVYGSPYPTGILGEMSSRASVGVYGTPTGLMESISAIASQRLVEGLAQASSQYSNVRSAVGATSTPQSQKYLDDAKLRYYAAVGMAHDRYSEFVSSASAAVMPTPTPAYQSIFNRGSEAVYGTTLGAVEGAMSSAQASYSSVSAAAASALNDALNLRMKSSASGYAEQASASYSSVLSQASASMESASREASIRMYGTPTCAIESAISLAQASYSSASSAAASALSDALNIGKKSSSTGYVEAASSSYSSILSQASASMESASKEASARIYSAPSKGTPLATPELHGVLYGTPKAGNVHHDEGVLGRAQAQYAAASAAAFAAYNNALKQSDAPKGYAEQAKESYSSALAAASASLASVSKEGSIRVYGTPTGAIEGAISSASSQYSVATAAAAAALADALNLGKKNKDPQGYAEQASASYSSVLSVASASMESASREASLKMYGTSTGAVEGAISSASSQYAEITASAASALSSALHLGKSKSATGYAEAASSSYSSVLSVASASMESASREASIRMYGTPTGSIASLTSDVAASASSLSSVASENWEAVISKASIQVYGQPTPWASSILEQATDGAGAQYVAMQQLINELMSGKEPDFTESVYSRFSSAYHTPISEAVHSASSVASLVGSSVLSAAGEMFTPPPAIEHILEAAQSRVEAAVDAASVQVYGTSLSPYEKVQESVSSMSSVASVKVYGSETGYVEAASSSIAAAASSAQEAILAAVYGESTPTPVYASATSIVGEYASKITGAVHGKDETREGSVASAQARLGEAVESARVKLAAFASMAGEGAEDVVKKASEGIEEFASSISSAVTSEETVEHLKDAKNVAEANAKVEGKVKDGDRGFHDEL